MRFRFSLDAEESVIFLSRKTTYGLYPRRNPRKYNYWSLSSKDIIADVCGRLSNSISQIA